MVDWSWNSVEDFYQKYGPELNDEAFNSWLAAENFIEVMGILVEDGFLDKKLISSLCGGWIISQWEKFEPVIQDMRDRWGFNAYGEHEKLYLLLKSNDDS
jgi:hypothetical protein